MKAYVGTAGWTIPPHLKTLFPPSGSHLQRYAQVFNAVEINSSFYRDHRPESYLKWASFVPARFRFSVKLSKYFMHERRLRESGTKLKECICSYGNLGEKWGVLLIQLPPSLNFEFSIAETFMKNLRKYFSGNIVWEPRHSSWSSQLALDLLEDQRMNKVLADPERCKIKKSQRAQVEHVRYLRLHGTPQIYKSKYPEAVVEKIARSLAYPLFQADATWCIFDNTTYGFATENAWLLTTKTSAH